VLADRLAERVGAKPRAVLAIGWKAELDELHLGNGVEDVEAEEPVGAAAGSGQFRDAQRRRGRREQRGLGQNLVEGLQEPRLRVSLLDYCLDRQRGR
jgi:hypothetical protein